MGQQDSSNRNDPKTRQVAICRTCLAEDAVSNSRAVEKMISHPMHKNHYPRMVCAGCWERGRVTPVTCRTFTSADR
jgi:hypothetical protein